MIIRKFLHPTISSFRVGLKYHNRTLKFFPLSRRFSTTFLIRDEPSDNTPTENTIEKTDESSKQTNNGNNEMEFFWNMSAQPFPKEVCDILLDKIDPNDIEIKPDGVIYLPEIKYRKILNKAFGPGGWGLMPRGSHIIEGTHVAQQYALFCLGQFCSQAWGEQSFDDTKPAFRSLATALEGARSNALMRCCKDLGIASELWDPQFIIEWKEKHEVAVWCEHVQTGQKKLLYRRKDRPPFEFPWKEINIAESKEEQTSPIEETEQTSPVEKELFGEEQQAPSTQADDFMFFDQFPEPYVVSPELEDFPKEEPEKVAEPEVEQKPPVQTPKPAAQEQKKNFFTFDLNATVQFGKYKGKLWSEVMKEPGIANYFNYLHEKGSPAMKKLAQEALEYLKSN